MLYCQYDCKGSFRANQVMWQLAMVVCCCYSTSMQVFVHVD